MSEIVIILGAGASKQAGAPLMSDFLDVAERLYKNDDSSSSSELVFKALAELNQVYAKSNVRLHNLEEAFAAFEMAKLLGRLGNLTSDEINRLPDAMQQLILSTISRTVEFPIKSGAVIPPKPYGVFVEKLLTANRSTVESLGRISVITFNYDLCLDYACYLAGIHVDYGLSDTAPTGAFRLLKLHGSLNWVRCSVCNTIIPWHIHDYFRLRSWNLLGRSGHTYLDMTNTIKELRHCDSTTVGPVIVPPTWNKGVHHAELANVWRVAADELRNAEQIYVCGYSLPDTDQFFRYLYALGSIGPARLKRFCVFNPDPKVADRFQHLLGNGVLNRFQFGEQQFGAAIESMIGLIGK